MEIILMRHGKSGFTDTKKVAAHDIPTWISEGVNIIGLERTHWAGKGYWSAGVFQLS